MPLSDLHCRDCTITNKKGDGYKEVGGDRRQSDRGNMHAKVMPAS